jgi:hypothetical protein
VVFVGFTDATSLKVKKVAISVRASALRARAVFAGFSQLSNTPRGADGKEIAVRKIFVSAVFLSFSRRF